jgi:hypothetical protein
MTMLRVTMAMVVMGMPSVVVMIVIVSESERLRALGVRPVSVRPPIRVLVDTPAVSVSDRLHRGTEDSSLQPQAQGSFRNTGPAERRHARRRELTLLMPLRLYPRSPSSATRRCPAPAAASRSRAVGSSAARSACSRICSTITARCLR